MEYDNEDTADSALYLVGLEQGAGFAIAMAFEACGRP